MRRLRRLAQCFQASPGGPRNAIQCHLEQKMAFDFDRAPLLVIWEVTQACDLACVHCRASAQPQRHPHELSTE